MTLFQRIVVTAVDHGAQHGYSAFPASQRLHRALLALCRRAPAVRA